MTENEAIEELKYDCNELGKAIPCDTSWGCCSFENAYGMAIKALEKQIPKPWNMYCGPYGVTPFCPVCERALNIRDGNYCSHCGQRIEGYS